MPHCGRSGFHFRRCCCCATIARTNTMASREFEERNQQASRSHSTLGLGKVSSGWRTSTASSTTAGHVGAATYRHRSTASSRVTIAPAGYLNPEDTYKLKNETYSSIKVCLLGRLAPSLVQQELKSVPSTVARCGCLWMLMQKHVQHVGLRPVKRLSASVAREEQRFLSDVSQLKNESIRRNVGLQ
eukprot:scaffold573718_cov52-Prasinocladus_malaysianus.AAC.1